MPSNDAGALGTDRGAQRSIKAAQAPAPDVLTPADRYQELCTAVQQSGIFSDSKTFVDCAHCGEPAAILEACRTRCREPGFDLPAFVHANFRPTLPAPGECVSVPGQPIGDHIAGACTGAGRDRVGQDARTGRTVEHGVLEPRAMGPAQWLGAAAMASGGPHGHAALHSAVRQSMGQGPTLL
jgi:hypothetical protein